VQGVQAKKVLGYMILPGVVPRVRGLFASGFGYIAFLMANIYNIVRLLPNGHPYLVPQNIGKFGIRHVIAAAADNLVISRKNIDQLIIFAALLCGIVILFLQVALLLYGYIVQPAVAGTPTFNGIFDTPSPQHDIAFVLLDHVFGIPQLFCNAAKKCTHVQTSLGANGLPIHQALHSMFRFYSLGLLIVGVLIFMYFIVVVIAETAVTGTPFGQRFQNVWVPIRLVVALGLLVPINFGLNSGQYITLFAAKAGSGFATNGWLRYNETLGTSSVNNPSGENPQYLVSRPRAPDITPMIEFMSLVHACAYSYWHMDNSRAQPFTTVKEYYTEPFEQIDAYFVKTAFPWMSNSNTYMHVSQTTTYDEAIDFFNKGDITFRFGIRDSEKFPKEKGHVEPTCGEITVRLAEVTTTPGGANQIQKFYFDLIKEIWFKTGGGGTTEEVIVLAQRFAALALPTWSPSVPAAQGKPMQCLIGCSHPDLSCTETTSMEIPNCELHSPPSAYRNKLVASYQARLQAEVEAAWQSYTTNSFMTEMNNKLLDFGWGGAGIWYNKIHQINGTFINAVTNLPAPTTYPILMEEVRKQRLALDSDPGGLTQFNPSVTGGKPVELKSGEGGKADPIAIAKALSSFFMYWHLDGANQISQDKTVTGIIFKDIMNFVFGTEGLQAMRGTNASIHPLAQLSALGKGLVDSAVRNVAGASSIPCSVKPRNTPATS
jgi:conjugal transfer/type IV secretion protein DotA/TraY